MIWRLSGWSSTTKMRLLMPFPPVPHAYAYTHPNAQMKTRLRGLSFQYQQCHYCIRYACGEGWLRGFSPPAGATCRSTTTGSLKANDEPWPGCDSTQILPPC